EDALGSLNENKERVQWLKATDDSYRGLVRVLLEQKKPKEALDRWEWYQSRPWVMGFHSGVPLQQKKPKAVRPQTAQETAQTGTTHLVYANFKDGLQIWVSSSAGVQGA